MSQLKVYKGDNQVYPEIQTTSISNDVDFMSPITVDVNGNAFCGITVIEVEEDGFYIVDKNMNAAFSSLLEINNCSINSGGTTIISADTTALENRISQLETVVSQLQNGLGVIKISIEN